MPRKLYSRLLSLTALLGAVVLVVAACGGADPTAAPAPQAPAPTKAPAKPTATPEPTATLGRASAAVRVSRDLEVAFEKLDFELLPQTTRARKWNDGLYDYIVGADGKGKLSGTLGIATSWETNSDSTQWTFKIRKGATFHNGDPVTAHDVKFTQDHHARPESTVSNASYLREKMTTSVPDEHTMVVDLSSPNFQFPADVLSGLGSGPSAQLLSKKVMEAIGDEEYNKKPMASGPWEFREVNVGSNMKFDAFQKHWRITDHQYTGLALNLIPEEEARVALLKSGKADVVAVGRARGGEMKDDGFYVFVKPGSAVGSVFIHEQHHTEYDNPLGDVRVRKAMNLSIDRQLIVDTYLSGLATATVDYPIVSWDSAHKKHALIPYDPDQARALLKEADRVGFDLDLHMLPWGGLPEGPEIMEYVATSLEDIGINVNRIPTTLGTMRTPWFKQDFGKPSASGVIFISNRLIATALGAYSKTSGPRLTEDDELATLGGSWRGATNLKDYKAIGQKIQDKTLEKYIYMTMFEAGDTYAGAQDVGNVWSLGKFAYSIRVGHLAAGGRHSS